MKSINKAFLVADFVVYAIYCPTPPPNYLSKIVSRLTPIDRRYCNVLLALRKSSQLSTFLDVEIFGLLQ